VCLSDNNPKKQHNTKHQAKHTGLHQSLTKALVHQSPHGLKNKKISKTKPTKQPQTDSKKYNSKNMSLLE
jgi:hypothetical protein